MKPGKRLREAQEAGHLVRVSTRRSQHYYGVVLGVGRTHALMASVGELRVDGWIVVPVADVTKVRHAAAEAYNQRILAAEGRWDAAFCTPPDIELNSWVGLMQSFIDHALPAAIHLDEEDDEFLFVGRVERTDKAEAEGQFVTGAGRWLDERWTWSHRDVERIEFGTDYVELIVKHSAGPE